MKDLKPFLLYPNAPIIEKVVLVAASGKWQEKFVTRPSFATELQQSENDGSPLYLESFHENCKLQLRRLSSITEEHKRELLAKLGYRTNLNMGVLSDRFEIDTDWDYDPVFFDKMPYKAADYLRENSYDIDGYIEQAKAIELK